MELTLPSVTDFGTVITALATVALFAVTLVLARETRRLADMTSHPQVNASIQTNRWAFGFADLHVENTGTATAFDIEIDFDPPLTHEPVDPGDPPPLQRISLLRPGQHLSSYLSQFTEILDETYTVTISWKLKPQSTSRETICYTIRVADIRGSSQLGSGDPLTKLATELEKIGKDLHDLTTGSKKPSVNIITSQDRRDEREARAQWHEEAQRKRKDAEPESP